jgi:hypothetical protein
MDDNVYSAANRNDIPEETGDILQHLLAVETRAAALVDDAQAEADRRIKASEEQNRERYEEAYRLRLENLEAEYREKIGVVKAEYQANLEAYRKSLDAMTLHIDEFSCLAEKLLFGDR